jgi:hypothetical protein
MKRALAALVLAPFLLFGLQAVSASLLLRDAPAPEPDSLPPVLASLALNALTLTAAALSLRVAGLRRGVVVFLLAGAIPANNLIEAFFFQLAIPRDLLLRMLVQTLMVGALFALILEPVLGRVANGRGTPAVTAGAGLSWARIVACDALFTALYVGAGMLVLPFVEHFYGSRVPQLPPLVLMQAFRGLILTGIVLALVRTLSLPGASAPIAVGCLLALLGGVAPLLNPNPYMPSEVRFAHMVEVGVSYFAFGLLAALILRTRDGTSGVSVTILQ